VTGWAERALAARERELAAGRVADTVGEAPMGRFELQHAERLLRAALAVTTAEEVDRYLAWAKARPWAARNGVVELCDWWARLRGVADQEIALDTFRRLVADGVRRLRRKPGPDR